MTSDERPPLIRREGARKSAMLARTADNLFWLARYMERADFLARIVEATQRLAALPRAYSGAGTEWDSALASAGAENAFYALNEVTDEANVVEFLTFDPRNPSSICNCIAQARNNARAVRTALTVEVWDAINGSWLELRRFEDAHRKDHTREALSRFLEFVKRMSLIVDGSAYRTLLRDDGYWFSRLGLFMERADNTARILDVKYHVLLPETESVGGSLDYFQWTAILRAVSALTAYRHVYHQSVTPYYVADLLILRPEMPRSLIACYGDIVLNLDAIGRQYGRQGPAQRQARKMMAQLENSSMREIFRDGLHEFIQAFLDDNNRLGAIIAEQFLV